MPDDRHRLPGNAELPAHAHRQQAADGAEEHAGEEVLEPDHLVIVRPDVGAEEPVMVRVVVVGCANARREW